MAGVITQLNAGTGLRGAHSAAHVGAVTPSPSVTAGEQGTFIRGPGVVAASASLTSMAALASHRRRRSALRMAARRAGVIVRRALTAPSGGTGAVAGIKIAGTGKAVPEAVVSNDDLSEIVDTNDEWITQRTGIRRRCVVGAGESLASISVEAAKQALDSAGMDPEEVELVILATSTPDDLFGTATEIAHKLGAKQAVGMDLTAACSGFVFALVTASQYFRSGAVKSAVIIGADALSKWVDWSDRSTCVLFGDGAGAVVLRATDPKDDALIGFELGSDGGGKEHLGCYLGGDSPVKVGGGKEAVQGTYSPLYMNGKEVFRFATTRVPAVLKSMLARYEIESEDIDWLLLHQANRRIMDSAAKRFKIPQEKIICNLDKYGNTSAASIPLALDEAVRDGRVKPGQLVASVGFGAGLSWGGMLLRL
eukprot:CAMPEP_0178435096 /NCGR_PEP_ID=MMETSP0689_2-20121128/33754_1 /TAXON_ID=160604 /ORGANISM="Amphidinium massartii, Strain CS-259" /LENGTH=422 /DNA_ID=CAMNT_0020057163 /DNA_START=85 /DNA_END=1353 /DNA_ORIENTATION=-